MDVNCQILPCFDKSPNGRPLLPDLHSQPLCADVFWMPALQCPWVIGRCLPIRIIVFAFNGDIASTILQSRPPDTDFRQPQARQVSGTGRYSTMTPSHQKQCGAFSPEASHPGAAVGAGTRSLSFQLRNNFRLTHIPLNGTYFPFFSHTQFFSGVMDFP